MLVQKFCVWVLVLTRIPKGEYCFMLMGVYIDLLSAQAWVNMCRTTCECACGMSGPWRYVRNYGVGAN